MQGDRARRQSRRAGAGGRERAGCSAGRSSRHCSDLRRPERLGPGGRRAGLGVRRAGRAGIGRRVGRRRDRRRPGTGTRSLVAHADAVPPLGRGRTGRAARLSAGR